MSGAAPYSILATSYSPTSDRLERFLRVIVVIMTACSVAFSGMYAVQLGESWAFKAIIALAASVSSVPSSSLRLECTRLLLSPFFVVLRG
jgi:hypothetical protein